MGTFAQKGADEIVAGAAARRDDGTSGPGTGTRHVVIPAVIEVNGDTAIAVSHFVFLAGLEIRNAGSYRDTLIRTENGWQISVRTVSLPLAQADPRPIGRDIPTLDRYWSPSAGPAGSAGTRSSRGR
jgi:hypothetical protein